MEKTTKTITLYDALKACTHFKETNVSKYKILSTKSQYIIRSNVNKLAEILKGFEEIREEMSKELQEQFFDEEHSETAMYEGQETRKVKEKYMKDYMAEANRLNNKLTEILKEQVEVEIYVLDMEAILDALPDDSDIDMDDMDMLCLFETT